MLKNRHFISYFVTALMYILMISLFFYAQNHYLVASKKSETNVIQLCMSSCQPESVTPVEQTEEEQVKEEPVVEEEPTVNPEVTKEPIPEPKPEIKEDITPEPVTQKVIPQPVVKKLQKKPEVKKKTKKKIVKKKKQVKQKASSRNVEISPAQKNQFLANIRAKINKHKSYPRIAKKRGMQGTVKVKFTILRNGDVGNISVSGPKVFHKSARNAVKSAFPINTKNAPISLPKSVNITLRYQLR